MTGRVAVALAGFALGLASCGGGGRELVGYTLETAPQVDTVALPDVSRGGEPFELRARTGGLLVVYFGYTNCPDVCPTTMS
ncbi:MAG TPA: SCO family protein, partial [Ilumatobacteraceae bacterium]|nr:SCO family protein [Ilumatobacteraceae bacterium]